jgi:hypothetical protein
MLSFRLLLDLPSDHFPRDFVSRIYIYIYIYIYIAFVVVSIPAICTDDFAEWNVISVSYKEFSFMFLPVLFFIVVSLVSVGRWFLRPEALELCYSGADPESGIRMQ